MVLVIETDSLVPGGPAPSRISPEMCHRRTYSAALMPVSVLAESLLEPRTMKKIKKNEAIITS